MAGNTDSAEFFGRMEAKHRGCVCARVHQRFPGLSPEDIEDVWSGTIVRLVEKWNTDRSKLLNGGSIAGLVWTIAYRSAIDFLRRKTKQAKLVDVLRTRVLEEFQGGSGQQETWCSLSKMDQNQTLRDMASAFENLPPAQRLVLSVYCDSYPSAKTPKRLLALLMEHHPQSEGSPWSLEKVAWLLDDGRKRILQYLKEGGYDLE